MKILNPLNKTPLSPETMVNFGCHCFCSSGSEDSKDGTWVPWTPNCSCSCGDGEDTPNYNANYMEAHNA